MNNDTILRVFHPIGQGAFYSERHDNFNIVYDCGEWKNSKRATKVVEESFEKSSTIDILFISHFDFDHVSKINVLKKSFDIRFCILPVIYPEQKKLLSSFYQTLGYSDIVGLINNPSEYFGSETKIIEVEIEPANNENDEADNISTDDLQTTKTIKSGTKIYAKQLEDWIYVPYNKNCEERIEELKRLFEEKDLNIEKFKEDINYGIKKRKTIQQIYTKLTGGINSNSMLLYSGPDCKTPMHYNSYFCESLRSCFCARCFPACIPFSDKPGCIFTGDANLSDIQNVFKKYWDFVGTIQVPHHGSAISFDFNFFNHGKNIFIFPASYGNSNTYGHPAQNVICNIIKNGSCFIHVTEHPETIFIQKIWKEK